jgi:hypothetical protein
MPTQTAPAVVPGPDRYKKPAAAALYVGLKETTLKALRGRGDGPRPCRVSRNKILYDTLELDRWMAERRVHGDEVAAVARAAGAKGAARAKELGRQGGRPRKDAATRTAAARP